MFLFTIFYQFSPHNDVSSSLLECRYVMVGSYWNILRVKKTRNWMFIFASKVALGAFKWFVCQHFGYPAEIMNGSRVTDKTQTIPSCQWHTWSDSVSTLCIDGVELWFGFAHNIVCTWKKGELFNLIYFTSTFINFSFSFNFMNVKSYNKTFQNACATRLNKSLLVQSYILSL